MEMRISRIKGGFHELLLVIFLLAGFFAAMPALAEENINVNLRIEAPSQTILNQQISVPYSCEVTDSAGATSTYAGYKAICALQSAQEKGLLTYNANNFGWGLFIEKINNIGNDANMFWSLYQNNGASMVGATDLPLSVDDKIVLSYVDWNYSNEILQVAFASSTSYVNSSTTLQAQMWSGAEFSNFNSPVSFFINGTPYEALSGVLEYTPDTDGQKEIYMEAVGKTRSEKQTINVIPAQIPELTKNTHHVNVNYLNEEIFNQTVSPTSTWFFDNAGNLYSTSTVSALGVLAEASRQGNFQLTIQSGWGYYVSEVAGHAALGFDGWVYNINQQDPGWVAMNDYQIQNNDSLQVFYSVWPWKIESNTSSVYIGENITFKALNYASSTWQTSPSTTISINNQLFVTDDSGQYIYTPNATGTLSTFIYGSESWPTNSPTISVTVLSTSTLPVDEIPPPNNGGGGGGSDTPIYSNIDTEKAIQYLTTKQQAGNFSSALYTDWAAIAFGAYNRSNPTSVAIKNYLLTDPSPTAGFNGVSDYARRAMALMALEINPYQTKTNYIKKITDTFNGTELIDNPDNQGLFNDDIFALITLRKAGYSQQDEIIKQIISFVLSKQTNDNWGSIDLTAAAIQALKPFSSDPLVSKAITDATLYLKNQQQTDGGFANNSFSTSWTIQAGDAVGESNLDWIKKAKDYLSKKQKTDGSVDNDLWATTQAISAALDKSWNDILASFPKPTNEQQPMGGSAQETIPTPTTTPSITPTSTPTFATSTPTSMIQDAENPTQTATTTPEQLDTPIEQIVQTPTDKLQVTNYKLQDTNKYPVSDTQYPTLSNENLQSESLSSAPTPTPPEPTNPVSSAAKKLFAGSSIAAGGLGLYLTWRLLQTMI